MASQSEIEQAQAVIARLEEIFGKGSGAKMYWMFQARKYNGAKLHVSVFTEVLSTIPKGTDKDRARRFYMSAMQNEWRMFQKEQERKTIGVTYDKLRSMCETQSEIGRQPDRTCQTTTENTKP